MRIRFFTGCVLCLCGLGFAQRAAKPSLHADHVVVHKKDRTLELINHGRVIRTYRIALGGDPVGPKSRQGDHKTPEGRYILDSRNAQSHFHKSIHISYPNASDRATARRSGISPGGDVFVHGLPNGYGAIGAAHRLHDWTDGCIAVTDAEIDEIWSAVPNGTPIEIKP
jgi:murein L,D-transpeptidase YafK